ncbi:hypothetical protein [Thalassoglobus polymorphus]|uniref:Cytochrome c domain-containing protein n=1 Tax=Thalassoglobus polymorphus TaxID=2527994 RepID=A0A517QL99_9PLAN|nr:hypothetical protein [Thalassoglobus polymorphus]QDT32418.1 hypothetical protein Mal48_16640 [Thalassoglobus polymorphus]
MLPFNRYTFAIASLIIIGNCTSAVAQLEFEAAPINYSDSAPTDSIAQLQKQLDEGKLELKYDEKTGYLPAILDALKIPRSSQMLVFSKTSLQLRRITPKKPRALYFNDDTYVGFVQGGDVIEISTADPQLGGVFYSLDTTKVDRPQLVRDQGQCITCHASSRTEGVPGHLMRSVFADRSGQPHYGSGTYTTKQSSPFEKRFGAWYVSGTHGEMRHMGNVISPKNVRLDSLDRETGANLTDISDLVDTTPYLEETSDLVALMVLAHQLELHNLLTRGNFEARSALHYNTVMNKALEREEDYISDSTHRRVASVGERIVACMLFADEFQLTSPIQGVSSFREDFESCGKRDSKGRSLRDFDLQSRIFKYPCSYLIYSEAFDALPIIMKDYVSKRLIEVLESSPEDDEFENLTKSDRQNILEILRETKPTLFAKSVD